MPETTVNKYDRFVFGQHNIRLAGQAFVVKPVSETPGKQKPAHKHFGPGILALYPAHVIASGGLIVNVCHKTNLRFVHESGTKQMSYMF